MSPSDVAGVFSRYFIVGFFLPAFFILVGLSQALTTSFQPSAYVELSEGAQIAVLGGTGLLLGLLLLGLNYQIFRIYEGYPLVERRRRMRVVGRLHDLLVARQRRAYQCLVDIRDSDAEDIADRGHAAWKLDQEFPASADALLPTRFGNAILAFETHARKRWGLDSVTAWPRVDMLLSEREGELQANSRGEAAFFVNGSLLLFLGGIALIANQIADSTLSGLTLLVYLVPFAGAVLLSHWGVGAATRWGSAVRAAIDLHRLELYGKLGVRLPVSFADERENIAESVNQALIYGHPIPDEYFDVDKKPTEEEQEE